MMMRVGGWVRWVEVRLTMAMASWLVTGWGVPALSGAGF